MLESCHLTAPVDARRSATDVRDGCSEGRDQLVTSDERAIAMLTGIYRDARADDCCIGEGKSRCRAVALSGCPAVALPDRAPLISGRFESEFGRSQRQLVRPDDSAQLRPGDLFVARNKREPVRAGESAGVCRLTTRALTMSPGESQGRAAACSRLPAARRSTRPT